MNQPNDFSNEERFKLLTRLKERFEKNMHRHETREWERVLERLEGNEVKLRSLYMMEQTGGEPDVVDFDTKTGEYIFCDCSPESPKGRRSICFDAAALQSRKENKPKNSAKNMAEEMGIELLNEVQYRALQKLENFDTKTSSWLDTPAEIRKLGGAIFGDFRYGAVFIYHNGAESYYAARAFRGTLRV